MRVETTPDLGECDTRRALFQKHEVVTTIVLAMLLQFTPLSRIIPDRASDPDYLLRILIVAGLALMVILGIWVARRIGIWRLTAKNEREPGELYLSVTVLAALLVVFVSVDSYCFHFHDVGGFPLSLLMVLWTLAYLGSTFAPQRGR